eukprot:5846789-Pyramimonas_sp.AAC.1
MPAPPLPAPTQPPPPFSAPAPESLHNGMARPVGPDSEEEDEAMIFVGWGSGDKHALDNVANLMGQNKDEEATKRLREATTAGQPGEDKSPL